MLKCSVELSDKVQTTLHKPIPTSKVGRDFYYQNSISKKSSIFYNFIYDNIFAFMYLFDTIRHH
jgi:hypothetical protein